MKTARLKMTLALCSLLAAFGAAAATFERGDWSSSGDLPMPYKPAYGFRYKCQAQITDQLGFVDQASGQSFRIFAIADFVLDNSRVGVNTRDLVWEKIRLFSSLESTPDSGAIPFVTDTGAIYLRFEPRADHSQDVIHLGLFVTQPLGDLMLSNSSWKASTVARPRLESTVSIDLRHKSGAQVPQLMLRAVCNRI